MTALHCLLGDRAARRRSCAVTEPDGHPGGSGGRRRRRSNFIVHHYDVSTLYRPSTLVVTSLLLKLALQKAHPKTRIFHPLKSPLLIIRILRSPHSRSSVWRARSSRGRLVLRGRPVEQVLDRQFVAAAAAGLLLRHLRRLRRRWHARNPSHGRSCGRRPRPWRPRRRRGGATRHGGAQRHRPAEDTLRLNGVWRHRAVLRAALPRGALLPLL